MGYYMGDYYRGDFWSGLKKGVQRVGRDIGRVAKAAAPIAGILLPAVGAATLVGRGVRAAARVKEAGRTARELARTMTPAEISSPATPPRVVHGAAPVMTREIGAPGTITAAGYPIVSQSPVPARAATRKRRARSAYRRRKARTTTRRRSTTRRRRRSGRRN